MPFLPDYKTFRPIRSTIAHTGTINGETVEFFIHAEDPTMEVWFDWRGTRYGVMDELSYSLVKMSHRHNNALLHFEIEDPNK